MDRARVWPAANRLHEFDGSGTARLVPLVGQVWVPDVQGRSARAVLWRLVTDLVGAVEPHLDRLPVPAGVSGLDRLSWALGGTPGHVARLVGGEGDVVSVHDLSGLLYLAGVDRAGLEAAVGREPLSVLVAAAGLDRSFVAAAAQAEAGTVAPSASWLRSVADAAGVSLAHAEGAWVAGALSWAAGASPGCGLERSRQALVEPGAATVWQRKVVSPGLSLPAEWVVLGAGGTLADLAVLMDEVGSGPPPAPVAHWQWRVPVSGVALTPDTLARGTLLLGCLDMAASPEPKVTAGPWVVADSTRVRGVDAVPAGGTALVADLRSGSTAAVFTLVGPVPGEVATADRFLRAQQGEVAGAAWPSSGVAVEALDRVART